MKIFKIVSMIGLLTIFLIGCDPFSQNKNIYYDTTKSIDLSEEHLHTISFESHLDDVKRKFGDPTEIEEMNDPPYLNITYKDNNGREYLSFRFVDDRVQRYMFSAQSLHTEKRIKIGDSKEEVTNVYGNSFYEREETGVHVLGYFDKENEINIEFILTEGKVSTIIVAKSRGEFEIRQGK